MHIKELAPFGLEVRSSPAGADLRELSIERIRVWVAEHRVLVLRGFEVASDEVMLSVCGKLGDVLQWDFGAINDLRVTADSPNYLYTTHAVPFHWDGAFVGRIPHYIFFHCAEAPPAECGGETTFCDTVRLLQDVSDAERDEWSSIRVTYSTEKLAHYGGSFTSPLIDRHPVSREPVIRFAEPVDDLNPVHLTIEGVEDAEHLAFVSRMQKLLYDSAYVLDHAWKTNDIVIADNHALLHGRRAFHEMAERHLRRVNVL